MDVSSNFVFSKFLSLNKQKQIQERPRFKHVNDKQRENNEKARKTEWDFSKGKELIIILLE